MLIKLQKFQEVYHKIVQRPLKAIENTKIIGFDRKIPKERHISPEKRQRIIDKLRLI